MSYTTPAPRRARVALASTATAAALGLSLLSGGLAPASAETLRSVSAAAPVAADTLSQASRTVVTINGRSRQVSGTNITREANRLVVFTSPYKKTTRTARGVDVVVVAGKVKRVNVRVPGRGRARVAVPAGGFVVSGAGTAATWLRDAARVGSTVVVKRVPTSAAVRTAPALVAGAKVTVGTGTRVLSGVNTERSIGAFVAYRAPLTRTSTNMWGLEVTVVNGRVVARNDREVTRSTAGTAIPAGGYVLSAHGDAADWLRGVAKVGAVVSVGSTSTPAPTTPAPTTPAPTTPAPTTPAPTTPAAPALAAGTGVTVGSSTRALTGVNIERAVNALVAYRSPLTSTPTNMWGIEVTVVDGRVTALNDRQLSNSGTGTTVPAGGWVLSAHGDAGDWLRGVARVGGTVTLGGTPAATPAPTTPAPTTPAPADPAPTEEAPVSGSTAPMGLPARVQSVYHMMWSNSGSPQLRNTPSQFNVVNLSFMQGDEPRIVGWGSQSEASFLADARELRARGVRIVASVGGADGHVNVANREGFVRGVMALNAKTPLDGIDWDIEGSTPMAASDVVWISKRLKELRGNKFAITLAPNGSNIDHYRAIAVQLQAAGALDMIGQQFYDAVVSKEAAKWRVGQLVDAGIPQSKIAVGMMVGSADVYWTVDECITAYQFIKASYPGIRGSYLWEAGRASTGDWATRLSPVIRG